MALSVWVVILDHASQNESRGNIGSLGFEDIAALLGFDEGDVNSVLIEMRRKGMILPGGMIANWAKRQPERERDLPDYSSDRVRAFRDRKRSETHGNAVKRKIKPETAGNVIEEIRVEEKRVVEVPTNGEESEKGAEPVPAPVGADLLSTSQPINGNGHRKKPRLHRTTEEIEKALGVRLTWWKNFWDAYPCHEGMNPAMDAFEVRIRDHKTAVAAWHGARAYAARAAADSTSKLKYGQGWINEERWLDENKIPVAKGQAANGKSVRELIEEEVCRRTQD
jgi:hypothetical protein